MAKQATVTGFASSEAAVMMPFATTMRLSGINRDRFVAHRRIDLMCDETADSASVGTSKQGNLSISLHKDNVSGRQGNRKKSDSISSTYGKTAQGGATNKSSN